MTGSQQYVRWPLICPSKGAWCFPARGRFPKGLPRYTLMLDSIAAEFPSGRARAVGGIPELWRTDWARLSTSLPAQQADGPEAGDLGRHLQSE